MARMTDPSLCLLGRDQLIARLTNADGEAPDVHKSAVEAFASTVALEDLFDWRCFSWERDQHIRSVTFDTVQIRASAKQVYREEALVSPPDLVRLLEASIAREDAGYLLFSAQHPSCGPTPSKDAQLFGQCRFGNYMAEHTRIEDLEALNRLVNAGKDGGQAAEKVREAAVLALDHHPTLPHCPTKSHLLPRTIHHTRRIRTALVFMWL